MKQIDNNSIDNCINNLYNSVFNNVVIKRNILNHNKLINDNIHFSTKEEWDQFEYKDYVNNITLGFYYNLELLPKNIKSIKITLDNITNNNNNNNYNIKVPEYIESIDLKLNLSELSFNSIINSSYLNSSLFFKTNSLKITTLSISCCGTPIPEIIENSLPISITSLDIQGIYNYKLKRNVLPPNLKKLTMYGVLSIEEDSLPATLTEVHFGCSNPLIINQFATNGLLNLKFSTNTTCEIGSDIKFPVTLKTLDITRCGSFNSTLPNSLSSLSISMNSLNNEIVFPSLLENLSITFRENNINNDVLNHSNIPKNLKSLKITCSSITDNNSGKPFLPDSLESLVFYLEGANNGFNQELRPHQLPSSLTYLNLGTSFNQVINQNALPLKLKTLVLGNSYTHPINPSAIPPNLQLLDIQSPVYSHPINLISTHPNTLINCNDINIFYNNNISNSPSSTSHQLYSLKIPNEFDLSLSNLSLKDKSNLYYLHLGDYNQTIQLSDLPINNNIKILELGERFKQTINLEYFQNLETIIINSESNYFCPKIKTKIEDDYYNFYNLKSIYVNSKKNILKHLDINFYHFLKKKI